VCGIDIKIINILLHAFLLVGKRFIIYLYNYKNYKSNYIMKNRKFNIDATKILVILGIGVFQSSCVNVDSKKAEKPNIVLIYADDLGYGDLGCYGATKVNTPNIDHFASQGRLFTDAHTVSAVCSPSRYALLTGEYPFRKDLFVPVFDKQASLIDTSQLTIASMLKEVGYSTCIIGKWHLGFGEGEPDWNGELNPGPLELGFDYYFGIPVVNSHPPFVYVENHHVVGLEPDDPIVYGKTAETKKFREKMNIDKMGGAKKAHSLYDDEMVGTTLAGKAVDWIKANKNHPFFLYFPTTNIHHPFTPNPRFNGTSEAGIYGDFIHELDWIVGEVLKTLEDENLVDNTLVIITSDNGGMLNMGGQEARLDGHKANGDLLGFKFDSWEGGQRIPMIVRWPGRIEAGSTSDQLITNVDILSTLASLVGYNLKSEDAPDSYNMLPVLMGTTTGEIRDNAALAALKKPNMALRQGDWVFIGAQGGGGFSATKPGEHMLGGPAGLKFANEVNSDVEDGKLKPNAPPEQLYNLKNDLVQSQNVILENPDVAKRMRDELNKIKSSEKTRPE
jgi:arylsulfatase A-like enzyme